MGDITKFPGVDDGPRAYIDGVPLILPIDVLNGGIEHDLETVLVLGWDKERNLYAASTESKIGEVLLLMDFFKHRLLAGDYDLE